MYICVCVCVYGGVHVVEKRASDSLELELQVAGACDVGAGNETVLCK